MNSYRKRKNKVAQSLLEVMIVLAIISVTIVSAMSIVVKANTAVKTNEIEDQANSKMLEALEAIKSHDKVYVSDTTWLNGGSTYNFSLEKTNNQTDLLFQGFGSPTLTPSNCGGPYLIININFKMCLQVQITPKTNIFAGPGASNYYLVDIIIIYYVSGGPIVKNLSTYRYQTFCLVNTTC